MYTSQEMKEEESLILS